MMASPTQFVARIMISWLDLPGRNALMNGVEKSRFLGKVHFDYGDVDGHFDRVNPCHVLDIFFGGDQGAAPSFAGGVEEFVDFAVTVVVMVGEGFFSDNRELPIFQVEKKSGGIANATEDEEGSLGSHLLRGKKLGIAAKFAKTKQFRFSGKDRESSPIWRWRLQCRAKFRCA